MLYMLQLLTLFDMWDDIALKLQQVLNVTRPSPSASNSILFCYENKPQSRTNV